MDGVSETVPDQITLNTATSPNVLALWPGVPIGGFH